MTIDSYIFTSQGGRAYNEDAVGSRKLPDGALFIVADGLGGHVHGELASECIIDCLKAAPYEPGVDPQEWLRTQLLNANRSVLKMQEQNRMVMKTTAVVLLIQENRAVWAHVGDSRLYYLHDSRICAYTDDHSVAYKKYKAGEISRAQIGQDEDQSSLLRALGNLERGVPDLGAADAPLESGDAFVLCSDGIWTYLRDDEILIDRHKARSAQDWGELMLVRLMERWRPDSDNLSLITVVIR